MIKKQKINLTQLKKEAESAGLQVESSIRKGRCYLFDGSGIMIATTAGAVVIPIEQAKQFHGEFRNAMLQAKQFYLSLNFEDKNRIAKEKHLTYGKMRAVIEELGVEEHEQEN